MIRLGEQGSRRPRNRNVFGALATAILSSPLSAQPVVRAPPTGWEHRYRYQSVETVNGSARSGYSMRFELQSVRGVVYARIISAFELADGAWKNVAPAPACRKAMNGGSGRLAKVRLYPVNPGARGDLGASFLAECAPPALFYPLTDILNVLLIPWSGEFRARELSRVGDHARFQGIMAAFVRGDREFFERSPGGETRLAGLDEANALFEWYPEVAELRIIDRSKRPNTILQGTEHWAFRVAVRRSTGALETASTIYDDLDLKLAGSATTSPNVHISRTVIIRRD